MFRRKPERAVVVYSRDGCHLCDEALELLKAARRRHRLDIRVVDIAGDPDLEARHGERIPVVEIDGRERFFGRIDPVLLRRLLDHRPNQVD